jgi:hypothetical protein
MNQEGIAESSIRTSQPVTTVLTVSYNHAIEFYAALHQICSVYQECEINAVSAKPVADGSLFVTVTAKPSTFFQLGNSTGFYIQNPSILKYCFKPLY